MWHQKLLVFFCAVIIPASVKGSKLISINDTFFEEIDGSEVFDAFRAAPVGVITSSCTITTDFYNPSKQYLESICVYAKKRNHTDSEKFCIDNGMTLFKPTTIEARNALVGYLAKAMGTFHIDGRNVDKCGSVSSVSGIWGFYNDATCDSLFFSICEFFKIPSPTLPEAPTTIAVAAGSTTSASTSTTTAATTTTEAPLQLIDAPSSCANIKDLFTITSNEYLKTVCLLAEVKNHDDAKVACESAGMRLFKLDSFDAKFGLFDFADSKWPAKSGAYLHIDGKNSNGQCGMVTNYGGGFVDGFGDCSPKFSFCEFINRNPYASQPTPMLPPATCSKTYDIATNDGTYVKSICYVESAKTYIEASKFCKANQMQLFQLDNDASNAAILHFTHDFLCSNKIPFNLFVFGQTTSLCRTISYDSTTVALSSRPCSNEYYFFCEFVNSKPDPVKILPLVYQKLVDDNSLLSSDGLKFAVKLNEALKDPGLSTAGSAKLQALKANLPDAVRMIAFGESVKLRNKAYSQMFYSAGQVFYDESKRALFTRRIRDDLNYLSDWKFVAADSDGNAFLLKNEHHQEYLFAETDTTAPSSTNRRISTERSKAVPATGSEWKVDFIGGDIRLKNVFYDEFLLASDVVYDEQRRTVVTMRDKTNIGTDNVFLWRLSTSYWFEDLSTADQEELLKINIQYLTNENLMLDTEALVFARNLRATLDKTDLSVASRSELLMMKTTIPEHFRKIAFGETVFLKNVAYNQYFYPSATTYDAQRRHVFTWKGRETIIEGSWQFIPVFYSDTFNMKNIYQDEYLFADTDAFAKDDDRRNIFTWRDKTLPGHGERWAVTPVIGSKEIRLRNHRLNEYLYASNSSYNLPRRSCFTLRDKTGITNSDHFLFIVDSSSNFNDVSLDDHAKYIKNAIKTLTDEGTSNSFDMLNQAVYLRAVIDSPNTAPAVKTDLLVVKSQLPKTCRIIAFSEPTYVVNKAFYEVFYASSVTHDADRRGIFTWAGDTASVGIQQPLSFEPTPTTSGFKIRTPYFDEYIYAADDTFAQDANNRRIFSWIPKGLPDDGYDWEVEVVSSGEIRMRNIKYNEHVYASETLRAGDTARRLCFTMRDRNILPTTTAYYFKIEQNKEDVTI